MSGINIPMLVPVVLEFEVLVLLGIVHVGVVVCLVHTFLKLVVVIVFACDVDCFCV